MAIRIVSVAVSLMLLLSIVPVKSNSRQVDLPFGMHPASMSYGKQDARSFEAAVKMNVRWHRPPVYAFQFIIQKDINKPVYDFSMFDNLYGAVPQGLQICANITADTGLQDHGYFASKRTYLPKDIESYRKFVRATVERYDGDGFDDMPNLKNPVKYWQVDNEPNGARKDYAKLLEITYKAIKEADTECCVLIGGATGFPDKLDSNFKRDFEPILKVLNGKYFDIFDFHWYGTIKEYAGCKQSYELIRKTLGKYNFEGVPVWITEMGSYSGKPDGPMNLPYQSENDQANDVFRKLVHPLGYGIEKVLLAFGMIEGFVDVNDNEYFDNTGLIYDGIGEYDRGRGVRKLSYWTYRLVSEKLGGCDLSTIKTLTVGDSVTILKFNVGGNEVYACWFDWWESSLESAKIVISDIENGKWKVTEAVPEKDTGKDIQESDYPKFFKTSTVETVDGKLVFELGRNPIIIEH